MPRRARHLVRDAKTSTTSLQISAISGCDGKLFLNNFRFWWALGAATSLYLSLYLSYIYIERESDIGRKKALPPTLTFTSPEFMLCQRYVTSWPWHRPPKHHQKSGDPVVACVEELLNTAAPHTIYLSIYLYILYILKPVWQLLVSFECGLAASTL